MKRSARTIEVGLATPIDSARWVASARGQGKRWMIWACLMASSSLTGCAGYWAYQEGRAHLAEGRVEDALSKLKQAADRDPQNVEFRKTYFVQRDRAVDAALQQAILALDSGRFDVARQAFARALDLNPAHPRAQAGAGNLALAQAHWRQLDAATAHAARGDLDSALQLVRTVLADQSSHPRAQPMLKTYLRMQAEQSGKDLGLYPKLKTAYRRAVSLTFSNATLQQVFESLKQASGLNYVFDRDVKTDTRVTLSVNAKPVEDILRLLLATHQLDRRVLDEDTLLIYPNTPAKSAEYREMVVRTFSLTNADATRMANMVKTIAKARDVVVDEKLNLLVVRDSVEVIRLVEKLLASQDLAEPEVMLELEVLEISANRLLEMGISWPSSVSATVTGAAGRAGQLTLEEARRRSSDLVRLNLSDPLLSAQLRSQVGSANLLANPRVRVRNKQSAKILIGERVPVFTTTATANVGTFESVSYLDVGLKLDIEPTVSLDDEVSMKLALEVSNILEVVARASGTQAYRLGTRNTSTTLRVKDGETHVLAGLIQRDERKSNTGVPGLNELPVISKLFGASHDNDTRTEIVLLVTPRIVRNLDLPGLGQREFLAGTDASVGAAPIQLGVPGRPPAGGSASPVISNSPSMTGAPPNPRPPPSMGSPGSSSPVPARTPGVPALTEPPLIPTSPGAPKAGSAPGAPPQQD